jgi:hypothetical protein
MIYKFLSLLFLGCGCGCFSAFSQELQSPQINQNAIFANPGLAGSKGQTRIGTTMGAANNNYYARATPFTNGYSTTNHIYSGLGSIDGLILKNKIGIGAYLKNEYYQKKYTTSFYDSLQSYHTITNCFNYSNIYMGLMIAPKFYIHSTKTEKPGRTLSPAIGIGFKATQFNYSGDDIIYFIPNTDTIYKNGMRSSSISLDYISLGLLYSTPKSYWGLKCNFNQYNNYLFLHDISLVVARSYFNKKVTDPNFSFNPQFYIALPIYQLSNHYHPYWGHLYQQNSSSFMCLNLDFRYKKILFGTFADWTMYNGIYTGITGGVQLSCAKIMLNYSPRLSPKNNTTNGLFISANFLLKAKKTVYR